jgi:hypothetical protein
LVEIDNLAVQPGRDGQQVDQAGEVRHKEQVRPELTKEREAARTSPLIRSSKRERQQHRTSTRQDRTTYWSGLELDTTMEAAILKVAAALVALLVGSSPGAFAQGLSAQAATIQKQDRAQREARLSDLYASTRPSPAEIHRCAAGHRLNVISRSACKLR